MINKDSKSEHEFDFGLNYWPSYVRYDFSHNSGAYDFRPIDNLFANLPYSQIKGA
jgi:hypothetical protein